MYLGGGSEVWGAESEELCVNAYVWGRGGGYLLLKLLGPSLLILALKENRIFIMTEKIIRGEEEIHSLYEICGAKLLAFLDS
jgi:hypothetical protein